MNVIAAVPRTMLGGSAIYRIAPIAMPNAYLSQSFIVPKSIAPWQDEVNHWRQLAESRWLPTVSRSLALTAAVLFKYCSTQFRDPVAQQDRATAS